MYIQLLNTGISCSLQISTIYFLNTDRYILYKSIQKKPILIKRERRHDYIYNKLIYWNYYSDEMT